MRLDFSDLPPPPPEHDAPELAHLPPAGPGPYSSASTMACAGGCGRVVTFRHSSRTYPREIRCTACYPDRGTNPSAPITAAELRDLAAEWNR